jgi:hypothetical protein
VPILVAIVDIRLTVILIITARAFNAVVEAATLHVVPCVRRTIPVISILTDAEGLRAGRSCVDRWRREQKQGNTPD